MDMNKIKVGEMFAGVGGFHLALLRASAQFEVVWADQWEPERKAQYAYDVYIKHFGHNDNYSPEDVSTIDTADIPPLDMIVGGFPCQDYSVAHSGAKGIKGKKGVLWWDIHRIVLDKKPKYLFLENVDRLLTSPGVRSGNTGRDFAMILRTLNDAGYAVQWRMINAAEYGFPQRRRRTFIFAVRKGTKHFQKLDKLNDKFESLKTLNPFSVKLPVDTVIEEKVKPFSILMPDLVRFSDTFNLKNGFRNTGTMINGEVYTGKTLSVYDGRRYVLGDMLEKNVEKDLFLNKDQIEKMQYLKGAKDLIKTRKRPPFVEYRYAEGAIAFPDDLNKPSRTMVTSEHSMSRMSHVVTDKSTGQLRLLSPEETEKLNTFPEGWTEGIPRSSRYFTMGNALVVNLVRDIAKGIISID